MEKYAVVKEKLKKLSAEQTRGDIYDPFLPAHKKIKNAHSKQPQHRSPQEYSSQEAIFSVARAIGTLQNRSHQTGESLEVSDAAMQDQPFVTEPVTYEDDLIAQEIHRLELRAIDINNRSQQQAEDILNLKRAAQQAAIAFVRQGIHDHPQLDIINHFFDRYATSHVPIIERDDCGHFTLGNHRINLRRAEEEAIENAAVLRGTRQRDVLPSVALSQPMGGKASSRPNVSPASGMARPRQQESGGLAVWPAQLGYAISELGTRWKASRRSMQANASRNSISKELAAEPDIGRSPRNQEFSLADGAIWFSTAAIVARLGLKTLVSVVPIFQPIFWLAPLSLFCAAIYLLFVTKSSNSTLMYRLVLVALGLFLSGSL